MRKGNHTISQMQAHIVWVTKYRYEVLKCEISSGLLLNLILLHSDRDFDNIAKVTDLKVNS